MTRHRWMTIVPYDVTPEDARRMTTGEGIPSEDEVPSSEWAAGEAPPPDDPRPWFGLHNMVRELVTVGCYVCEQAYSDEVEAAGCPGDPAGRADLRLPDPRVSLSAVGRNDPCPCGSGLKFKRCHGA